MTKFTRVKKTWSLCDPAVCNLTSVHFVVSFREVFIIGIIFRRLESNDFDFAIALTGKEKWYLTAYDLELYVTGDHGTGLIAVVDGVPVGLATAAIYDRSAWIGNVIIDHSSRNRGLGRMLVEAHMQKLRASGINSFLLYAYDRSKSLYERIGFNFDAVLWEVAIRGMHASDSTEVMHGYDAAIEQVDLRYFPCSRGHILRRSSKRNHSDVITHRDEDGNVDGYLFTSYVDTEYGSEVAPFVCRRSDVAAMISAATDGVGIIHLYVPEQNIDAIEHIGASFQRVRRIHRGYLGSSSCLPYLGPEILSAGFLESG